MPPAVAAAGIGAGASLVGGVLGNRAQGQANKANAAATDKAMAYEREKDAARKKEYDEAKQRYDFMQQQAWKMKQGVLSRYGIHLQDLPQFQAGAPGGAPGAVPRSPVTLGAIARAAVPPGPQAMPPDALPPGVGAQGPAQGPSEDPFAWSNWRQNA